MRIKKIWAIWLLIIFIVTLAAGCENRQQKSKGSPGFSFIFMSDSQADPDTGDYTAWGKMLQMAAADPSRPAFIMMSGDLVNDGNDQEEWDAFFRAGGQALKDLKLYPAVGNHDNTELFNNIFDLPYNGPPGKKGTFYSFDYGDAHFTVLDSNAMGAADQEDIDWFKNDLAQSDKKHKIVMFHHPVYPAVDIPKDIMRSETIQKIFVPIMEKAEVDLVLSGHQHVYMRTYPLINGERNEEGIVYLMGASGGKQYTAGDFRYIACSIDDKPVYSIIYVNQDGISIETRDASGTILDSTRAIIPAELQNSVLTVKGDGIEGEKRFTFKELAALPHSGFQHLYSTVNNWPTPRFYAAKGINIHSILQAAGVLDKAQVITFRSSDSYEISFTREQLLETRRYYYPQVADGLTEGAELVEPIIAYAYKEGSRNMSEATPDAPCLIIGQSNPMEHSNPAFVVNVNEIVISNKEAEKWEPASTFPQPGKIAPGELVKLQHKDLGLVKLHYTLDGTEPTILSPIYNISTYQPQLNVPITIKEDTVIKVLVTGYGKKDSDISSFTFDAQ
jgi:predicted MPP superfamily phosphohydrolase